MALVSGFRAAGDVEGTAGFLFESDDIRDSAFRDTFETGAFFSFRIATASRAGRHDALGAECCHCFGMGVCVT